MLGSRLYPALGTLFYYQVKNKNSYSQQTPEISDNISTTPGAQHFKTNETKKVAYD